MRLRYIEVTNFLGHEHEKVSLPDTGIFFLRGTSGSGKSSFIIDAVGYVLFGPKATRASRADQLRHIDHPGAPMEVRALFELDDGSQFTVVRGINAKGTPWAEIYEPDPGAPNEAILLAETAQRVSRIIRKRLNGMTWQQFYAAFVARQVEISMLTSMRGAARKELFHRLLGMRELEKAAEEISTRLRAARAQLKGLEGALGERTRSSEDERIGALREDLDARERDLAGAQEALQKGQGALQGAQAALEPLEARGRAHEEAQRLEAALAARRQAVEALSEAAARSIAAQGRAAALPALEEKERDAQVALDALRADYARSEEHVRLSADLAARRAAQDAQGQDGQDEGPSPEELRTRLTVLRAEVERARAEEAERRPEYEMIKEAGTCPTCLRPLGEGEEHEHALGALEGKLTDLSEASRKATEEIASIEGALPSAEERQRAREQAERERAQAAGAVEQTQDRLRALESEGRVAEDLDALKEEGRAAAQALQEAQGEAAAARQGATDADPSIAGRLAEAQGLLSADEEALEKARAACGEGFSPTDLDAARAASQEASRDLAAAQARAPEISARVESVRAGLSAAEVEREALLDKLDKAQEMRSSLLRLETMQTYLSGFQRKLAADIRPPLEEMGSEMLEQVSGGKHVAMRIDDAYEIEIQTQAGTWLPSSSLSGGESVRVNICLRLALTRLVSQRTGIPVRTLVFDEPLPSQDAGHVQRIMELLDSLRPWYPQQFIISHVGEVASSGQVDYILDFDGEGSEHVALSYA
jgi:exonuclease SbcC